MFLIYNRAGIVWAVIIFILCSLPGKSIPHFSFWHLVPFDKMFHIGLFAILVFLLCTGFFKQFTFSLLRTSPVSAAIIISIIYGGIIEICQTLFFTGRAGSIGDFIANGAGCLIGSIGFRFMFAGIYPR